MKIEIAKSSKEEITNNDRVILMELIKKCVNTNYLISETNKRSLFVVECVHEECVEKIKKYLVPKYEITVYEDSFWSEIDLMDLLSGGFW